MDGKEVHVISQYMWSIRLDHMQSMQRGRDVAEKGAGTDSEGNAGRSGSRVCI